MVGTVRTAGRVILRLNALHFAQRAFCAAAILLRAPGDIVRLCAVIETTLRPLTFAHRARWAAAILWRPAADMPLLRGAPFAFRAASALLRLSSSDVRRLRSCSS
jgi:hypothetical protein